MIVAKAADGSAEWFLQIRPTKPRRRKSSPVRITCLCILLRASSPAGSDIQSRSSARTRLHYDYVKVFDLAHSTRRNVSFWCMLEHREQLSGE
jgi:hypothetical protein